jgi:hypothetical protein
MYYHDMSSKKSRTEWRPLRHQHSSGSSAIRISIGIGHHTYVSIGDCVCDGIGIVVGNNFGAWQEGRRRDSRQTGVTVDDCVLLGLFVPWLCYIFEMAYATIL